MRARWWSWLVILIVLSGCMAASSAATPEEPVSVPVPTSAPVITDSLQDVIPVTPTPVPDDTRPAESPPAGAAREFSTDFSRHTVPYSEILSGGPPKDGIPAVDRPMYEPKVAADLWLGEREPVIVMQINDAVRAYPIQILTWREIVNDTLGGVPVAVTFCPLCNTAIAFDRRVGERVLDFGTTGRLRYSNLIMYDRQTETWWQQATGEAIVGELVGSELTFLPATMIAWAEFRDSYPDGDVLSLATGFSRAYGNNPYPGYDDIDRSPFLYDGPPTPGRLPAMARILAMELNGETVAYPYASLETLRVVDDEVGGVPIVVMWQGGVASALGLSDIAEAEDVGTVVAYLRDVGGDVLTFEQRDGEIVDTQTGTTWDHLGRGVTGDLAGTQLAPVVGVNHFWFSWAAFKPETRVYVLPDADSEPELSGSTPSDRAVAVDALAMDFEILVYRGAEHLGGESVLLSEVLAQGKPVMVEFWAGLCPTCRRALPETQEAYLRHGDEVTFIGVDIGIYAGLGSEADARALCDELGLSFPVGFLPDPTALQAYRVTGTPTALYFKPNGELFDRGGGIVGVETLSEKLAALIAASNS